jgi:hypothetical protein
MNKITEARFLLQAVTTATKNRKMDDSFVKSYERATQMLQEMESTAPSMDSWSFNNHSDSKPSSVSYPTEKVPYIIKPNSTLNESLPHMDGN